MVFQKTTYITKSPEQTKKLGGLLAKTILKYPPERREALVLLLKGDLGSGKTQFVQGFAKGLGIKEIVNSPTFSIVKKYRLSGRGGFEFLYHIDGYRFGPDDDLGPLAINDVLSDSKNVVAVEWPGILKEFHLKDVVTANFDVAGKNIRRLEFDIGLE